MGHMECLATSSLCHKHTQRCRQVLVPVTPGRSLYKLSFHDVHSCYNVYIHKEQEVRTKWLALTEIGELKVKQ